jgi:hypothetical protein
VEVYAEGRLSEVMKRLSNTELKGIVEEWGKYIEMARNLLSEGKISVKEFEEKILNEAVPERKHEETLSSALKKLAEEKGVNLDELEVEKRLEVIKELLEEILSKDDADELLAKTASISKKEMSIILPLHEIMEMNGIVYEDEMMIGKLPDDPIVKIPVDVKPEVAEKLGLTVNYSLDLVEMYDVYIDVLEAYAKWESLPKDERLAELFMLLIAINGIVDILSERKKVEMTELFETAKTVEVEKNAKIYLSDETLKDLLKALEKYGMVKIKKNFVKYCG